ncbi:MAG: hypothetical protein WCO56_09265 [Verrucomicrobiota bacterium]
MKTKHLLTSILSALTITSLLSMAANEPEQTKLPSVAVQNIVPLKLGTSIPLSVQSDGVTWRGHTFHLVSLGSTEFDLDTNDCLKAEIKAGVACFDDVDYDISCAVFDAAGQLLGTARTQCKVQRVWLGNLLVRAETITLDFGTSLDYKRAVGFAIGISNRKVLTPDQWPKPASPGGSTPAGQAK